MGKCYLGRVTSGTLKPGDPIKSLDTDGNVVVEGRCTKILMRRGVDQHPVEAAGAGDIISVAGIDGSFVNHTICAPEVKESLPVSIKCVSSFNFILNLFVGLGRGCNDIVRNG